MNYLTSRKCKLNFRATQMMMGGNKVPLSAVDREGLPVMVRSTTIIPPKSSMLLLCRIKGFSFSRLGVVEHDSRCTIENGVTIGKTLTDHVSRKMFVVVVISPLSRGRIRKGPS